MRQVGLPATSAEICNSYRTFGFYTTAPAQELVLHHQLVLRGYRGAARGEPYRHLPQAALFASPPAGVGGLGALRC